MLFLGYNSLTLKINSCFGRQQNRFILVKLTSLIIAFLCVFLILDTQAASQQNRWWVSAEYLQWWSQDSPISVPLATQNFSSFAIINKPGTQIIFGKGSSIDSFHFDKVKDVRIKLGGWIDSAKRYGIEGSGFGLAQATQTFTASSVGVGKPILDVPFFSVQSASENVLVGNRPNTITDSDTFLPYSLELNGLYNLTETLSFPFIMSAGLRFMGIHEHLTLNDAIYNTPSLPMGSVLTIQDNFYTKNYFYGVQIGAEGFFPYGKVDLEASGKIALGVNAQQLEISGETNVNTTRMLQPIGLFAEPTNIGTFNHQVLAILPQLQVRLGYHLRDSIYPFLSYNALYISHIIRASNEIDRNINLSQNPLLGGSGVLSGPAAPTRQFNETSLWMQGFSIGVQVNLC